MRPPANIVDPELSVCRTTMATEATDPDASDARRSRPGSIASDPSDPAAEIRSRGVDGGQAVHSSGLKKIVCITLGLFFAAVGAAGAVLPGLPATPFLLLASYFFAGSSPKLQQRLLQSRLLGPLLRDWQQHRGIRRHIRIRALIVVAVSIGVTLLVTRPPLIRSLLLGFLGAVGVTVIALLPAVRE